MSQKYSYEPGTPTDVPSDYKIVVQEKGPYMVYGKMPIYIETEVCNLKGIPVSYKKNDHDYQNYKAGTSVALCRCGASNNKPYCDGSHLHTDWDPSLTAPHIPPLDEAEVIKGPTLTLTDAQRYCSYARYCDAYERTWTLTEMSDDPIKRQQAIDTACKCPSGRLKQWDAATGMPIEPELKPELSLLEDPIIGVSGPIWVKGGIPIETSSGYVYQVRNRVTLCRCGNSQNKPFCDGTHASSNFVDGLKY